MNTKIKNSSIGRVTNLTYYDVTNYYFETMYGDDDIYELDENNEIVKGEDGKPIIVKKGFRKKGVSKENSKGPIVQMGLFIDNNGIPVSHKLFPGNTQDKTTFKNVLENDVDEMDLGRIVVVADNGMNTQENKYLITEKGNGYIVSKSVKKSWTKIGPWALEDKDYNEIKNSSGKTVYAVNGSGKVPSSIKWEGKDSSQKYVADGRYTASLLIDSTNGSQAKVEVPGIVIDTKAPAVDVSTDYTLFSPDGDGIKDMLVVNTKNCSSEDLWHVTVVDKNGKTVYQQDYNKFIGTSANSSFNWDGHDNTGNKVQDGTYRVMVSAEDAAGNKFVKTIENVVVDTRACKAFVTAKYEGISPESTTGLQAQVFNLKLSVNDGIKNWTFDVIDDWGKTVWVTSKTDSSKSVPKEIVWNGSDSLTGKNNLDGYFFGRLTVEYEKGNKVTEISAPFICSSKVPELSVKTTPKFFSPDNDGIDDDLYIKLGAKCAGKIVSWSFVIYNPEESGKKGKPFWTTNGTSKITEQLTWNGLSNVSKEKNGRAERVQSAMDYPWEFTVTDSLGLTSKSRGKISIDILVTRDGNVLKMAVPAIIFRSNAADFKTAKEAAGSKVTPEQAANNERVLKRVADVLNKFPDYTITVVGHANNITGTEAEETSTENGNIPLIPLSLNRAEFVKTKLKEYGVEENRMTTEGKGGRERIASLQDRENWWKNRRVEFLLHK